MENRQTSWWCVSQSVVVGRATWGCLSLQVINKLKIVPLKMLLKYLFMIWYTTCSLTYKIPTFFLWYGYEMKQTPLNWAGSRLSLALSSSLFVYISPSEQKLLARYPVRSGPKQMAAYLTDAGTLHVDVLRGGDMSIIGKVQIYGLSTLAAGKPLDGYASMPH